MLHCMCVFFFCFAPSSLHTNTFIFLDCLTNCLSVLRKHLPGLYGLSVRSTLFGGTWRGWHSGCWLLSLSHVVFASDICLVCLQKTNMRVMIDLVSQQLKATMFGTVQGSELLSAQVNCVCKFVAFVSACLITDYFVYYQACNYCKLTLSR